MGIAELFTVKTVSRHIGGKGRSPLRSFLVPTSLSCPLLFSPHFTFPLHIPTSHIPTPPTPTPHSTPFPYPYPLSSAMD
jgi:hypothetical protein